MRGLLRRIDVLLMVGVDKDDPFISECNNAISDAVRAFSNTTNRKENVAKINELAQRIKQRHETVAFLQREPDFFKWFYVYAVYKTTGKRYAIPSEWFNEQPVSMFSSKTTPPLLLIPRNHLWGFVDHIDPFSFADFIHKIEYDYPVYRSNKGI